MLEQLSDLSAPILGFRASGKITAEDYKNVLTPAVDAALKDHDKLRMLYILGGDVTGLSGGAAWQDTKVGIGHYTKWERVAVCTDKEWLRHSVDVLGYLMPGEVRAFSVEQEGEARDWLSS
jgi:SpoIIAA-like